MQLPNDYNTPIKDEQGRYHLCRPVLVKVQGGSNVAYMTEDGTEVKREPVHRYKNRVYRRKGGIAAALKDRYTTGEPIFAEDLRGRELIEINNLIMKGEIKVFEDGVYYFPETLYIGNTLRELPIHAESVIERKYLTNGKATYGYISGHSLRNIAGLTRQIPPFTEITTNAETKKTHDFSVGGKRIITHCAPVEITRDNVGVLQFLDLMVLSEPNHLDELSLHIFREWLDEQNIDFCRLGAYIKYFPGCVAANLEKKVIKDEITRRHRNIHKAG